MAEVRLITRESLIDMFASFDNKCRQEILTSLEKSIKATEEDATSGNAPDDLIRKSWDNLTLMRECCKQAQDEFDGLSKKEA